MANSPRYGFHYPISTDPTNIPSDLQITIDEIDADIVMAYQGVIASRPAPSIFGRQYFATDTGQLWFDTSSAWLNAGIVNTASGNIAPSAAGNVASAGSVGLAADAGHIHAREPIGQASDLQPSGAAAVGGSTGKWTDAGHVHPGDCIGDIKANIAGFASIGWIVANGQLLSRTTYATFYNACGGASAYPWGQGNGSTTFNAPNLQDKVLIGAGNLYTVGQIIGNAQITLSVANMPYHRHSITDPGHYHGINDPGHNHAAHLDGNTSEELLYTIPSAGTTFQYSGTQGPGYLNFSQNPVVAIQTNATGISIQGASTGITTTNYTGNTTPYDNHQPSAGVTYLVRVI